MEKVIKLLEEKGVIERLRISNEVAKGIAKLLDKEVSEDKKLKTIKLLLAYECDKDNDIIDSIVNYAFETIAKEVMNIINKKEENKND